MRTRIPPELLHGAPHLVVENDRLIGVILPSSDAQMMVWLIERLLTELKGDTSPNERLILLDIKGQLLTKHSEFMKKDDEV